MMTTATTLVFTIEYQILLSILSTSWVETPPPVLESVVVEGVDVITVFGVVVCVIGGSVGRGGMGVGGQGPGSGIVLLLPVTKQYTLKYSSAVSLNLKFYIAHIVISSPLIFK